MNSKELAEQFAIPLFVLVTIIAHLLLKLANLSGIASELSTLVLFAGIIAGTFEMIKETIESLLRKEFALDYIAILAIVVAIATQEYLVGTIIALMLSSGGTLEKYATTKARSSLTALKDRIPNQVILYESGGAGRKVAIESVTVGSHILVRKGEVIPLDGVLVSEAGQTDESSLTGEPYIMDKIKGDQIRSGTLNTMDPIVIKVTKADADSTYRKIIDLVKEAQEGKPPLIRLANKYSTIFTLITLAITGITYFATSDFQKVLAVLVIATPCPLILATPIALIGGMNSAAKKRIIIKKLASLEVLSRVNALIFDKTGTITLGKPKISNLKIADKKFTQKDIYAIAEAIERNSLHPLAKAIVEAAKEANAAIYKATNVEEKIGVGISGTVNKIHYTLKKPDKQSTTSIHLLEGKKLIAEFYFEDTVKPDTVSTINSLRREGLEMHIYTGDKAEAAERVAQVIGQPLTVKAQCTPEDKKNGVQQLKMQGKTTAMIGDGINDAPALAIADAGIVFSHEEHTAASEAADVVFLGGDLGSVSELLQISRRTIRIALQSIVVGIGLSIAGMILASLGYIPPILGALIQEAIDVTVIINALRASQ